MAERVGDGSASCDGHSDTVRGSDDSSTPATVHRRMSLDLMCHICGRVWRSRFDLNQHMVVHTKEKLHKCDICQMRLSTKPNLKSHYLKKHGSKACQMWVQSHSKSMSSSKDASARGTAGKKNCQTCQICGKDFTSKSYLDKHMVVHTGVKAHKCDICKESFTQKGSLKRHHFRKHKTHSDAMSSSKDASTCGNVDGKTQQNLTCQICGKAFKSSSNLNAHMVVHVEVKLHKCDTCKESFATKGGLKRHCIQEHDAHSDAMSSDEDPLICGPVQRKKKLHLTCQICGKVFNSPAKLDIHMVVHTRVKAFKCDLCEESFTTSDSLRRHYRTRKHSGHTDGTMKLGHTCPICGKDWMTSSELKTHMVRHTKKKLYKCDTCQMGFCRKWNLTRHCRANHNEEFACHEKRLLSKASEQKRQCGICNEVFETPSHMKLHMLTHKPFQCEKCEESFKSKRNLQQHYRIQHDITFPSDEEIKFRQRVFEKEFSSSDHDEQHPGTELTCSVCGKVWRRISDLRRHMRTHANRPYQCAMCDKAYETQDLLNQHNLQCHVSLDEVPTASKSQEVLSVSSLTSPTVHTPLAPPARQEKLTCPICDKTFDLLSNMKRHMIQHTGEKPFGCSICEEYFSEASALEEHHRKLHTKGRIPAKDRTCKFCGVVFSTAGGLINHSQTKCSPHDLPYEVGSKHEEDEAEGEKPPAKKRKTCTAIYFELARSYR